MILFMSELKRQLGCSLGLRMRKTVLSLSVVDMQLAALLCLTVRNLMLDIFNVILKSLKLYSFKVGELLDRKSGRFV